MSQILTVELSDDVYASIVDRAETAGTSPARLVAVSLEQQFGRAAGEQTATPSEAERQAPRGSIRRFFGSVNLGYATGVDNEGIDADLARE